MPQHQLFRTRKRVTGVQVSVEEERTPSRVGFRATVSVAHDDGPYMPVTSYNYAEHAVDLLGDLAMEAVTAFLYGEPGDVQRASATNWKVARAHREKHKHDTSPF